MRPGALTQNRSAIEAPASRLSMKNVTPAATAEAPAKIHKTFASVARDFWLAIWLSEQPALVAPQEFSRSLNFPFAERPATAAPIVNRAVAVAAVQKYQGFRANTPPFFD